MRNDIILHHIIYILSWVALPYLAFFYFKLRDEAKQRHTENTFIRLMVIAAVCMLGVRFNNPSWWTALFIMPMVFIFCYPLAYKTPCNVKRLGIWQNTISWVLIVFYLITEPPYNPIATIAGIGLCFVVYMGAKFFKIETCDKCHRYVQLEVVKESKEDTGEEYYEGTDTYETHKTESDIRTLDGKKVHVTTHHIQEDDIITHHTSHRNHTWYKCPVCGEIIHKTEAEHNFTKYDLDGKLHRRKTRHEV